MQEKKCDRWECGNHNSLEDETQRFKDHLQQRQENVDGKNAE